MSPLPLSPWRKLLLRSKFRRSSHPTSKKICTVFQNHEKCLMLMFIRFLIYNMLQMRLFWRFSSTLNVYYKVSSAQKNIPTNICECWEFAWWRIFAQLFSRKSLQILHGFLMSNIRQYWFRRKLTVKTCECFQSFRITDDMLAELVRIPCVKIYYY